MDLDDEGGLFQEDEGGAGVEVEEVEVLDGKGAAAATGGKGKAVDPSQRVTTRYMTKYERARLLGTRALQLR